MKFLSWQPGWRNNSWQSVPTSVFSGIGDQVNVTIDRLWSTRLWFASMLGEPILRLREDNTDDEADFWILTADSFGFGTFINAAGQTIAQWLIANGATSAFIARIYAQAGSTDIVQTVSASQPEYIESSINSKPAARFSIDWLETESTIGLSNYRHYIVWNSTLNTILYEQSSNVNINNGSWLYTSISHTSRFRRAAGDNYKNHPSGAGWGHGADNQATQQFLSPGNAADHTLRVNGSSVALINTNPANPGTAIITDTLYLGARDGGIASGADISEWIYTQEGTDADRDAIEENQLDAYGI